MIDQNFLVAYRDTVANEGLLSNNKADLGGLTWKGVAFNRHPKWEGWPIIQTYLKMGLSPAKVTTLASNNAELEVLVQEFYLREFWIKAGCNRMLNILIAKKIFDTAVNMGISSAIKFAESSVDLPETGKVSDLLIKKLNAVV